ncbi:MAG: DNA polymerase III subunit gamma/tau [Desulfovibrionaceae bacterium]|nr:DNA polymerase III subunit gamma/tau [Desulfovibrionaceae bacterium]
MSISNLTAKYRPQTFAAVVGQDAVKTILSRAAAEDKVAPAYLFSGTRGVGKTTVARIFAKALNCKRAPTAEPCNECTHCRQAAAGVAVDVIEIDAASHGGVDDARSLKEDVGYAPLESRYKVFIIDEAHMLSKQAFNALLKTLEEPPARVTFILATTEAHKVPPTIISRCQHYTFKTLTMPELSAHLEDILGREEVRFEPGAVRIIARRGAGSVRDSMSLLGQALALGGEILAEQEVRSFLGLAGQDVFLSMMGAIESRDLAGLGRILRQVLDQGLDLGFFLRELAACWRNMFLLSQAGAEALPLSDLSAQDREAWREWAGRFDPAFIHACWQMTLDGQRRVLNSLEPALALELLLLNMACLPDLLDLEGLAAPGPGGGPGAPAAGGRAPAGPARSGPASGPKAGPADQAGSGQETAPVVSGAEASEPRGPATWEGFLSFVREKNGRTGDVVPGLMQATGEIQGRRLVLRCHNGFQVSRLKDRQTSQCLTRLACEYLGPGAAVDIEQAPRPEPRSLEALRAEAEANPAVRRIVDAFQATLVVEPRER